MKFNFWAPQGIEPWDFRNYDEQGIGGSETAVCELAWRLAQRGQEVKVYSPAPTRRTRKWRGVTWLHTDKLDAMEDALWVVCRQPIDVERHKFEGRIWVQCQDTDYEGQWTEEVVARTEIIMPLCVAHARHLMKHNPQVTGKLVTSSNAIRVELFEELEAEGDIERDPHSAIFASSPDRGLAQAVLPLWPRIRERVPDATLHVYYGFDNIDRLVEANPKGCAWLGKQAAKARAMLDQPGVVYHGRVGQRELYRAWLSAAVWPQFSSFAETSCVVSLESQAGGAIPVTRPWWAVGENVHHGIFVQGDPYTDELARAQLVDVTANLMLNEDLQDSIRPAMMSGTRATCHWERIVDHYMAWAHSWPWPVTLNQYSFQHQHLRGKTLNIGCNTDFAQLKARGDVTNLDVVRVDPGPGWIIPLDVQADGRALPYRDKSFETAIIGDVLEHCPDREAAKVVAEAKRVARRVVVTVPEDRRTLLEQLGPGREHEARPDLEYADGICAWHKYPTDKARLRKLLGRFEVYQPIRYDFGPGHGVVTPCS